MFNRQVPARIFVLGTLGAAGLTGRAVDESFDGVCGNGPGGACAGKPCAVKIVNQATTVVTKRNRCEWRKLNLWPHFLFPIRNLESSLISGKHWISGHLGRLRVT
jgi:hypothetical protein